MMGKETFYCKFNDPLLITLLVISFQVFLTSRPVKREQKGILIHRFRTDITDMPAGIQSFQSRGLRSLP